jgi:hypothetical protein
MAITSGICISFRKEIMLGEHDLDTDAIKLALYTSAASLSDGTTAYTVTNEVVGTGYSAGGVTLTGIDVTTDSSVAVVSITDAVVPRGNDYRSWCPDLQLDSGRQSHCRF